jgi:hypothetical protein
MTQPCLGDATTCEKFSLLIIKAEGPAWWQTYRTDWRLTGTHGFQLVGTCMGVSGNDMGWRECDSGMSSG